LLTILKKVKEQEKEIRILILGLDNAGKTTVCKKYCGQPIDKIEPTLGFNIHTLEYSSGDHADDVDDDDDDNKNSDNKNSDNNNPDDPQLHAAISDTTACYNLNLWDIGGQSSIRAYWRNYFERTDGLIWVVDSCDTERLELCKQELQQLLQQERLAGASLLIMANKQDMDGSLSSQQICDFLELEHDERYATRHWSIQPCSAMTGDGLARSMDWLVEDISSRIFLLG